MKAAFSRIALALLSFPLAMLANEKVTIGPETIEVPLPQGFVRLDSASAEFAKAMEQLVPSSNRMLLSFATPAEVAKVKSGQAPNLERHGTLQTFRRGETERITLKQFSQVREGLEKQVVEGTFAASAQATVNEQLKKSGLGQELKIGEVKMLGVFDKTDRSIDVGILTKAQMGTEAPEPLVAGASTVVVRGKIAYLSVYSQYKGQADIDWVRATVKGWREAILAANPSGTEDGGFNWDSAGQKALVGGVIGGLAGLVSVLLKKRKAKAAA